MSLKMAQCSKEKEKNVTDGHVYGQTLRHTNDGDQKSSHELKRLHIRAGYLYNCIVSLVLLFSIATVQCI